MAEYTEIHDVIVSNERLEKSVMRLGEWQSYKAKVTDENGNAIPYEDFCVRLMIKPITVNGEPSDLPPVKLVEVCFAPDIYNKDTKEVAIAFTVNEVTLAELGCHDEFEWGVFKIYLEWDDQEFYIP